MDGHLLIRQLRLRNLLSYGPESEPFGLEPLNVLIGPNAVGKSNLIEAIALLQATPGDLLAPIRAGGGVNEWLWKGADGPPVAEIEAVIENPDGSQPLRHRLAFTVANQRLELVDEEIENERAYPGHDSPFFYYRYQHGTPVLNVRVSDEDGAESTDGDNGRRQRRLTREELSPEQSVLSQRRDPDQYPEITYLGRQYGAIRVYGEWNLGRRTAPRAPQPPDLPQDFLEQDARNLVLVINDLDHRGYTPVLERYLKQFYPRAEHITTRVYGGTVQAYLHERGMAAPVPATRLSDGMLRYLCLLAVLCHPEPPPLICIEEPELGLHPDVLTTVAELLKEAAQRTQLIVTTHSANLVGGLSDVPESVVVCGRDDGGTSLRRLAPDDMANWLSRYNLGDLWAMGEIGGNP